MKFFTRLLILSSLSAALSVAAETLDWEKIRHWTGNGPNKTALVIQFQTGSRTNPGAVVWGYRWDGTENPTAEEMIKAIAAGSADLVILTQITGDMGSTFCGAGYAKSTSDIIKNLTYDFKSACTDDRISFGFFEPNTAMGQTSAPGSDAQYLIMDAIDEAENGKIIEHPLNQTTFGYAAYDYDWWELPATIADSYWNAGWYDGYWSYWIGGPDMESLGYSGLGITSVIVNDGDVNAFRYNSLTDADTDAISGASTSWLELNYLHFETETDVREAMKEHDSSATYYRLDGIRVHGVPSPGLYVVREGDVSRKVIIR